MGILFALNRFHLISLKRCVRLNCSMNDTLAMENASHSDPRTLKLLYCLQFLVRFTPISLFLVSNFSLFYNGFCKIR